MFAEAIGEAVAVLAINYSLLNDELDLGVLKILNYMTVVAKEIFLLVVIFISDVE